MKIVILFPEKQRMDLLKQIAGNEDLIIDATSHAVPANPDAHLEKRKKLGKRKHKHPEHHMRKWTNEENNQLVRMYTNFDSYWKIGKALYRTPIACMQQMAILRKKLNIPNRDKEKP